MREAIARAQVGDDVFGEDETVRLLEERVADLLGKEAGLFVPSGTMANQIALAISTRPGEEVLCGASAHCMLLEGGAGNALAGLQFQPIGPLNGLFTAADVEQAIHPDDDAHYAATTLVAVENTHNRGGGVVFPQAEVDAIAQVARRRRMRLHLDGARLLNAQVASGRSARELAAPFDTATLCLTKGLGAPVGSLVCGTRADIARAHRRRKMLGGGMRQAGILAAAGLYALEHHVDRLADDHHHARGFAEVLTSAPGVRLDLAAVQTNIVIWELAAEVPLDASSFVARAWQQGVLFGSVGARRVRAVTHLDVDGNACAEAAARAVAILRSA